MDMFMNVTQDCVYLNHTFISRGSSDCFIMYQVLKTLFFFKKKFKYKFYLQIYTKLYLFWLSS